jgi:hypothetical protein
MSLLEKKQKLETFGTDDGAFERIPVVATSVVYFDKGETISRKDFFREKNRENALPNTEFPLKTVGMEITSISVEAGLNFANDTQDSLKREFHFLKNSVLRTMIRKTAGMIIPLIHCVPYAIEYDGTHYTKKMVRTGYHLPASIKLGCIDEFDVSIDPASGYKTDEEVSNVDPKGANAIRIGLHGTTTRMRYNS